MLQPIHELLFDQFFLALTTDQIQISYKIYRSDNECDRQAVIDQKLKPGMK